uniref:Uncharacterized protein n=1 Tax=Odontella aurita TaxID=265563 RepID=A0A7S4J9F6_9STRA|mmetsp:Transcript_41997/g.127332  ORF Transcript_41997/g.127332 Transcript_41997/m.127332 type:complete len:111 (+) Transcript_41997:86-418(+)
MNHHHGSSMESVERVIVAPERMLMTIFFLDAVAIFLWLVAFVVGPVAASDLVWVSTGFFCFASILAVTLPSQSADNAFWGMMKGICIAHVATIVLYIVAAVLARGKSGLH